MRERSSLRLRLDGRGKGGGAARAGPLTLPFTSVGPGDTGPLVGPGGVGSVPTDGKWECCPSLVRANEGALLLRHVWSCRGARRARGKHSADGHETRLGWAGIRREPAAQESYSPFHYHCTQVWMVAGRT